MLKFQEVKFEKFDQEINYLLGEEQVLRSFLKVLHDKNVIDNKVLKFLTPSGGQAGVLYGLCKVHKDKDGESPPFRPILSAINTPTYNLAKFLVPLLSELTTNSYVLKDSFAFATDIGSQNSDLFMTSFDIDSLFTNLLLQETINLCTKNYLSEKRRLRGSVRGNLKGY